MDAEQIDERTLVATLRSAGRRLTEPRRAVWSALADSGHMSVDDIVERTQGDHVGVDRATAYRALALLEELGLVRASQLDGGGLVRWERAHPEERFHLRCNRCGRVDHLDDDVALNLRRSLEQKHSFEVVAVDLQVQILCDDCQRL